MERSNKENLRKSILTFAILIVVIVALALLFDAFSGGRFLVKANINQIFISSIIASFAAWGFCFIFALNYMDLSVGAAIMISVYASGELGNILGPVGVVIGGVLAGVILMTINFNLFAWTKVPSWVAGLGMCLIYEAITMGYVNYKTGIGDYVVLLDEEYATLGRAPGVYFVFAIGLVLAYALYNRSPLGLNARSIGSNPVVAKQMGINIKMTLIITGVVCGIFVGGAGFIRESYTLRVINMSGLTTLGLIFPPLATVFLAQVLNKWINLIIAIPFCAVIIYICFNVLSIIGVQSGTLQESVLGLFVIVFGVIAQRNVKGVVK